jgi:hypothetical protein
MREQSVAAPLCSVYLCGAVLIEYKGEAEAFGRAFRPPKSVQTPFWGVRTLYACPATILSTVSVSPHSQAGRSSDPGWPFGKRSNSNEAANNHPPDTPKYPNTVIALPGINPKPQLESLALHTLLVVSSQQSAAMIHFEVDKEFA